MSEYVKGPVRGFKATHANGMCRNKKFKVGKIYKQKTKPSLCETGFHFCEDITHVLNYYPFPDSRFFEVVSGNIVHKGSDKCCSNEIKFVKEITKDLHKNEEFILHAMKKSLYSNAVYWLFTYKGDKPLSWFTKRLGKNKWRETCLFNVFKMRKVLEDSKLKVFFENYSDIVRIGLTPEEIKKYKHRIELLNHEYGSL